MSSSPFLRALMTAVCKAAVKGKHSTTWRRRSLLPKSHRWLQYLHSAKPRAERLSVHSLCLLLYWTDDNTNCRVDTAIIQRRLPVLLKYLNSDTERQLQALYALQALIVALDQPPSRFTHNDTEIFFLSYQRRLHCGYKHSVNCVYTFYNSILVISPQGLFKSCSEAVDHIRWFSSANELSWNFTYSSFHFSLGALMAFHYLGLNIETLTLVILEASIKF